ncbi:MAG TPA: HypC/HybG/HupF family hydrogenase formation chaperone [Gemmatimonadales bacterium]|nr:HypC/HybG/HupF family hydrogenase formation chaperone [Gemmatimonadales bacterium]
MCLGIPGEILETHDGPGGLRYGTVRFGGASRDVCLAYVPEAGVGDYVIVHVGLALSRIAPEDAEETFRYLEEMQELAELEGEQQAIERSEVP